jgi:pyrroloquinoline quinone (PQQ) biosynthesis protein C
MTEGREGVKADPLTGITSATLAISRLALENSNFFCRVREGRVDPRVLRHVLCQYRLWRDRFHRWFGALIVKSGEAHDPAVAATVRTLAQHISTEFAEDHAKMYMQFLSDMGVDEKTAFAVKRSPATKRYDESFFVRHGLGEHGFREAAIALSGRELFASERNRWMVKHLEKYCPVIWRSQWWVLHCEVEVEHFHGALRPWLATLQTREAAAEAIHIIEQEVSWHVAYWESLHEEALLLP